MGWDRIGGECTPGRSGLPQDLAPPAHPPTLIQSHPTPFFPVMGTAGQSAALLGKGPAPPQDRRLWLCQARAAEPVPDVERGHGRLPRYAWSFVEASKTNTALGLTRGEDAHTCLRTPAPEIINETDGYDSKVDCWSLGVILYAWYAHPSCERTTARTRRVH